jgi:hypothetical protein
MCLIRGRVARIVVVTIRQSRVASSPRVWIVEEWSSSLACTLSIVSRGLISNVRLALGRDGLIRLQVTDRVTPILILGLLGA